MSGKMSRDKGARYELEYRDLLVEFGWPDAERSAQFCGNSGDSDVRGGIPGTHCEVKAGYTNVLGPLWKKMDEATKCWAPEDARRSTSLSLSFGRNWDDRNLVVLLAEVALRDGWVTPSKMVTVFRYTTVEKRHAPEKFMLQAEADAQGDDIPYVAMRAMRKPWLLMFRQRDAERFIHRVVETRKEMG